MAAELVSPPGIDDRRRVRHSRDVTSTLPGRRLASGARFLLLTGLVLGARAGLSPAAAASEPVQLAPPLAAPQDTTPAADVARVKDASWRLCRVRTTVLLNMPDRSLKVVTDERLLALGESIDIERDIPMTSGSLAALVRLHLRIRASLARNPGVIYHVTTDAMLASAVGFESSEVGESQIRHAMLDVTGPGTRLHEVYVSPQLKARLIVALEAEPVFGREAENQLDLLTRPVSKIHRFKVEAFLKEREHLSPIDQMTIAALEGQDAVFALSRFTAASVAKDERRLGTASVATVTRSSPSGFEKDHVVRGTHANVSSVDLTSSQPDDSFMSEHRVVPSSDGPKVKRTLRIPNKKMSKKKREEIVALQQVQAVQDLALERSKTLPSGDAVPEGFDRTWFELHITPLHVTSSMIQAELHITGRLKLPREDAISTITTTVVEQLPIGEAFDIAVSELVHDTASDYDYLVRITPEP